MTRRYYSSTAQRTTLASPLSAGSTTMIVASTTGFPATRPYTLILDPDGINEEIATVTAASGTTLTVLRGEDGTTAVAHDLGATVWHGLTGRDLGEPQAHMDSTNAVHGVTGDVVGTSDTQTLTGKSMSGADNTFSNIPQSAVTGLVSDLAAKAPSASPTFTGNVVLPGTTTIGNVDGTEIDALNGVTSNVQAQLDALVAVDATKAPLASPTFSGTVVLPSTTSIGNVSASELAYLDGATSNIQQQILDTQAGFGPIPPGGNTLDILVKASDADYDFEWRPFSDLAYIPGGSGNFVVTDGSITGGDSTGTYTSGAYTYRWHKFTSTNTTLTLAVSSPVIGTLLMVGGGGAGGNGSLSNGSGGGGGGAVYEMTYAFGTGAHTCWVGAGGSGASGGDTYFEGYSGNVTATTLIAYGGGAGGSAGNNGSNGGSGGGGGGYTGPTGGSATYGSLDGGTTMNSQIFRAMNGSAGTNGGPGGGASMTGTTGWSSSITGSSVAYGGGGRGGQSFGAGSGGGNDHAVSTGGGGNGVGSQISGGAGRDGIIVVAYRIA